MIIVRLSGGLGNQMFQYALGRYLAEKNYTFLKLDLSGYEDYNLHRYALHCFNICEHIATTEEIKTFKQKRKTPVARLVSEIRKRSCVLSSETSDVFCDPIIIKEKQLSFEPSVIETKGNIYLDGYWQSEKYFITISDILLREFTFKYDQDVKSREIAEQIQKTKSVSLHIRRGDYVHNALTNQVHGLCSFDYYKKAVNYITKIVTNSHFYIFSDDPSWVRENFKIDYPFTVIEHNGATANFEDLRLMSLCQHNIIANSSFSWWGAWLNIYARKIVMAPEKWFNDPSLDAKDIIPEGWFKI